MNDRITFNWRYLFVAVFFGLFAVAIIFQMTRIQLTVDSEELPVAHEMGQWEKAASRRGLILDRSGHVLAGNQTVYAVDVDFSNPGGRNDAAVVKTIAELAIEIFEITNPDMIELLRQDPRPPQRTITVARFASKKQVTRFLSAVEALELPPGYPRVRMADQEQAEVSFQEQFAVEDCRSSLRVHCSPHLIRSYPEEDLAANVIGFVMRDEKRGILGVEEKYDASLFGNDRSLWALWDPHKADQAPDPDHGANIVLTIDAVLQRDVEEILDKAMKKNGSLAGTILVMDPESGDILAMASAPRADINQYWKEDYQPIINNLGNVFNYGIKAYEPGSVVKVLTMAAALDAGVVEPDTEFIDEGKIEIGGITVKNWNDEAWGPQTMTTCMQHSLNVCLAWVAKQLESEKFYSYFQAFGFGQLTGIELAGEVPGLVKNHQSAQFTRSELATNAFGQGIEITPVQMLKAISAIANDGEMVAPRIIHSIIDEGYRYTPPKTVVGHPISAETARKMTDMLEQSLREESSLALVPGVNLAGKTGTAEIYVPGKGYTDSATNASFVGWGPVEDPQFVVYVWFHKPATSIWGSEIAAPVFSKVVQRVVIHRGIPPDSVQISLQEAAE
jgi:cell division protein FtsI/penicillin-binding protein 2